MSPLGSFTQPLGGPGELPGSGGESALWAAALAKASAVARLTRS